MTASEILELVRAGYDKSEIAAMSSEHATPPASPVVDPIETVEDPAPAEPPASEIGGSDAISQLISELKLTREAIYGRRTGAQGMGEPVTETPIDEWVRRFNAPPQKKGE